MQFKHWFIYFAISNNVLLLLLLVKLCQSLESILKCPNPKLTKEQLLENLMQLGQKWHNSISYYTNPTQEICCLRVDGMKSCRALVAVKNFSNNKDLDKSYVNLIRSNS